MRVVLFFLEGFHNDFRLPVIVPAENACAVPGHEQVEFIKHTGDKSSRQSTFLFFLRVLIHFKNVVAPFLRIDPVARFYIHHSPLPSEDQELVLVVPVVVVDVREQDSVSVRRNVLRP